MSRETRTTDTVPRLRAAAHEIWLAGLGALSMAETEGEKLFKTLVKRGKAFEGTTRERLSDARTKLDVRKRANAAIERIGDGVDSGVTEVVHRLGLPTKHEIDGLTRRVDRLTRTLETREPRRRTRTRTPRSTDGRAAGAAE